MRLTILTALTMAAFAANSLLNREAVAGGMEPGAFAAVRVAAGAAVLLALALLRHRPLRFAGAARLVGAGSLCLYLLGFSAAYLTLGAGLGALILFGTVQIAMLAITALRGQGMSGRQALGAALALAGLAWITWPGGAGSADLRGAALMAAAGFGWAVYSLAGREEADPLAATAANFVLAVPVVLLALVLTGLPDLPGMTGILLAVISGAVTSGLGYALWYSLLPRLDPALAATVQLSVPVIALAGGAVLLSEPVSWRDAAGTAAILGGIALTLRRPARR